MSTQLILVVFGIASFVFVVVFTLRSYRAGANPRLAIIEAWINVLVGFTINYIANLALLPLLGASFTLAENFALGWIYTAISVIRQYIVRRWCQREIHNLAESIAAGLRRIRA